MNLGKNLVQICYWSRSSLKRVPKYSVFVLSSLRTQKSMNPENVEQGGHGPPVWWTKKTLTTHGPPIVICLHVKPGPVSNQRKGLVGIFRHFACAFVSISTCAAYSGMKYYEHQGVVEGHRSSITNMGHRDAICSTSIGPCSRDGGLGLEWWALCMW